MTRPQRITVLGATGSIGLSTLDVIARHPDRYQAFALSGYSRVDELLALCVRHRPAFAVVPSSEAAMRLRAGLAAAGCATEVLEGDAGLCQVASASEVDAVMAAIVGAAGLRPTLAAVEAGKKVLLANKEALVMSGALFMDAVRRHGAVLLPIDSEHNAIFQCMPGDYARGLSAVGVRRILLTASGGPFRETPVEALMGVTPEQACAHPNWSMGRKISVDSASMMNKGLELIEACWLFDAAPAKVEVVVHPQSVIHSLVDYVDGSVLASWATRTCAPRSPTPWPGPNGSTPGWRRWTCSRSPVWISRRPTNNASLACASRGRLPKPATVPLPCSMPPTKWRCKHFSSGVFASRRSRV